MQALFVVGSCEDLQGTKLVARKMKVSFLEVTLDKIGLTTMHATVSLCEYKQGLVLHFSFGLTSKHQLNICYFGGLIAAILLSRTNVHRNHTWNYRGVFLLPFGACWNPIQPDV